MDHYPLCPQATIYSGEWEPDQRHWSCHCDLIAKVRADTLNQAREAVVAVPWQSSMLGATVMRVDVVAAVDSLVATATPVRALKPDR